MIALNESGIYELIETKHHNKILYLGKRCYAWIEPTSIGEMLVTSRKQHKTDCVLSIGRYRVYDVDDEPSLSDQIHLELEVGGKVWQGYLLLSGLPTNTKIRGRIIPTTEVISDNSIINKRRTSVTVQGAVA